ncbi:MAG TPA: hypothetical protein VN690_03790 [Terriglobales bacterium]|nr:hypothetical protein [Terriglobales bacterium]
MARQTQRRGAENPDLTVPTLDWAPRSEAQQQALECPAEILLFGGAAGSLKSETMLMDAIAERDRAGLRALMLRRTYPELEMSLIRRSRELYAAFGGVYNETKRRWKFPSGGTVEFGYCESERNIYRYQGAEFTFIGFDESTHFSEFPIRYMLSRLRSIDPGMRLRVRLATNPGNIGHNTHRHIFHGPTCTHCSVTSRSKLPHTIYSDAVWPSDQHPIGKTTCFIPGRLTDHNLLGSDYAASLSSLPGAFRKALLEGCWDVYEGQFFDQWNPSTMMVPLPRIPVESWWPHWVGIDYGFSGSQSAAYLLCKSAAAGDSEAVTYVLDEYTSKHQTARDFARSLQSRFEQPGRRIVGWYLSPDAWNDRGEGHSLADQMQEATGIGFERASNDRVGGAMLVYTQLDRGLLKVASTCSELCACLPSRIHDPDRPNDILKIAGDPLDDCIDALRYAVYSFIAPARTPSELASTLGASNADPTIAHIQHRAAAARWQKASQGARYLRGR